MSAESHPPILRLRPYLQPSPYGRTGTDSLASRWVLATTQDPSITSGPSSSIHVTPDQTYGELWLSDHPDGISFALPSNTPLSSLITSSPDLFLTSSVQQRFAKSPSEPAKHIPFIFKVLSFDKPLPLQSHPPRNVISQLQKEGVDGIVDGNHKPEVAVALSDTFEAFIGFRPISEVKMFLEDVPELDKAIEDDEIMNQFLRAPANDEHTNQVLKSMFTKVLTADKRKIAGLCENLSKKVEASGDDAFGELGKREGLGRLWKKLWTTSKRDVGMFAGLFFCNYVKLSRGEGIAVPAGCIHAYIEGDVVECMAWSDNMIAHGLQDPSSNHPPDLLARTVTYSASPASKLYLQQTPFTRTSNNHTTLVKVPIEEFDLLKISLKSDEEEVLQQGFNGPSVFLATVGKVLVVSEDEAREQKEELKTGHAVFVMPKKGWKVKALEGDAEVWGAFVEGA